MNSSADLWYVELPDGDVHRVTVDQLDEAFQRGAIDRRARVFAQDRQTWISLGEILGEGKADALSPTVDASPYAAALPSSIRPTSVDFEAEDVDLSPYKRSSGKWLFAAIAVVGGLGVGVGYFRPDIQVAAVAQVHARVPAIASTISRLTARLGKLARGHEQAVLPAAPASVQSVSTARAEIAPTAALAAVAAAAAPMDAPSPVPAATKSPASAPSAGDPSRPSAASPSLPTAAPRQEPAPQGATKPRRPSVHPHPKAAGRAAGTGGAADRSPRPKSNGTQPFTTGGNKFDPLNSSI